MTCVRKIDDSHDRTRASAAAAVAMFSKIGVLRSKASAF
jgi:hypothetical protein